ncbi:MAG: hypothetical protein NTV34_09340, partial [Proteobacteria bacterium]|nr:hypothetical protein [Pseudomonadota bacterium]
PIQAPIKASANEIYLKMSTVFSLGTQEANSLDEACTKKLKELILETIESLIELIHGENHNLMLGDGALIDVNAKGVCGEFLSGFFAYFLQKKSNLFSSSQCKTLGTLENIRFMDSDPKALVLSIPDAIGVLPYLQGSQFEIFIDGRPLETLEASDFSTVFNLPEGPKGIDWFGLHPKTFFKGRELTTDVAKRFSAGSLVEFEGKFYVVPRAQIPSLKWLEYFWTKIHS